MRRCYSIAVLLAFLLSPGIAAEPPQSANDLDWDEALQSAEEWAKENLDENVLAQLQQVDQERVRNFFEKIRQEFQRNYVIDLAGLRDTARTILPLLETYEETYPYSLWLRPRLDYLDVAEEFRRSQPPPRTTSDKPAPPPQNPSPQKEREVWKEKFAERPWPPNAKPYVSRLKPIFAAEKVPPELVWLAEIESSFEPRARSPVGAAGLFQLMPATAKRYGLRTWPMDQRLKPEESARAAAQYLNFLHGKFKDWRLALAAYNSGEGTVQKLLDRRKGAGFDQISGDLPAETQLYVPKVEAALLKREGVKLSQLN